MDCRVASRLAMTSARQQALGGAGEAVGVGAVGHGDEAVGLLELGRLGRGGLGEALDQRRIGRRLGRPAAAGESERCAGKTKYFHHVEG
jgi:hypothetical protein